MSLRTLSSYELSSSECAPHIHILCLSGYKLIYRWQINGFRLLQKLVWSEKLLPIYKIFEVIWVYDLIRLERKRNMHGHSERKRREVERVREAIVCKYLGLEAKRNYSVWVVFFFWWKEQYTHTHIKVSTQLKDRNESKLEWMKIIVSLLLFHDRWISSNHKCERDVSICDAMHNGKRIYGGAAKMRIKMPWFIVSAYSFSNFRQTKRRMDKTKSAN